MNKVQSILLIWIACAFAALGCGSGPGSEPMVGDDGEGPMGRGEVDDEELGVGRAEGMKSGVGGTVTDHDPTEDRGAMPPFNPKLLVATRVGGDGDQAIRAVGIAENGEVFGEGVGFEIRYDS